MGPKQKVHKEKTPIKFHSNTQREETRTKELRGLRESARVGIEIAREKTTLGRSIQNNEMMSDNGKEYQEQKGTTGFHFQRVYVEKERKRQTGKKPPKSCGTEKHQNERSPN